jgi:hypothetical protein
MIPFDVDRSYREPDNGDQLSSLCWEAEELLYGHSLRVRPLIADGEPEQEYDDTDETMETLHKKVHMTSRTQLNGRQVVHLTNVPYVITDFNTLVPYTEAGYVALVGEPVGGGVENAERPFGGLSQVIFRTQKPYEPAAIFTGFGFRDIDRVKRVDSADLAKLGRILDHVRRNLRILEGSPSFNYRDLYLSQVPTPMTSHIDADELDRFFGA